MLPLAREDEGGHLRPIDLRLRRREGAFAPRTPLADVKIPKRLGEGIALGGSGIELTAGSRGHRAAPAMTVGDAVFYGGVDRDTDLLVTPTLTGLETFLQVRSADSPEDLRLALDLPDNARLVARPDGGVDVDRGAKRIATIHPPFAHDAAGTTVPVRYRVSGDDVVVEVEHRSRSYRYPLLVDPEIDWWTNGAESETYVSPWSADGTDITPWQGTVDMADDGWSPTADPADVFSFPREGNAIASFGESPGKGLYVQAPPRAYQQGDYAEWRWRAPGTTSFISSFSPMGAWFVPGSASPGLWLRAAIEDSRTGQLIGVHSYAGALDDVSDWIYPGDNFHDPGDDPNGPDTNDVVLSEDPQSGDTAAFGLTAPSGLETTDWVTAYLAGAVIYVDDPEAPSIDNVETSVPGSQWLRSGPVSVTVSASDPGLGVNVIRLTDVEGNDVDGGGRRQHPCMSENPGPCPATWAQTFSLDAATLPGGVDQLRVSADDPDAHQSDPTPVALRVDHSPPTLDASGTLDEAADHAVDPTSDLALHLDVEDGSVDYPESGVKRLEIFLDGDSQDDVDQPCTDSSCGLTHDWTLPAGTLTEGQHTVRVVVTDQVGNTTKRSWRLTVRSTATPVGRAHIDSTELAPSLAVSTGTTGDVEPGQTLASPITVANDGGDLSLKSGLEITNTAPQSLRVAANWYSLEYHSSQDSTWRSLGTVTGSDDGYNFQQSAPTPSSDGQLPSSVEDCHDPVCATTVFSQDHWWTPYRLQRSSDDQAHPADSCWRDPDDGDTAVLVCNTDARWQGWRYYDDSWRPAATDALPYSNWFGTEGLRACGDNCAQPLYWLSTSLSPTGGGDVEYGSSPWSSDAVGTTIPSGSTARWQLDTNVQLTDHEVTELKAAADAGGVRLVSHVELTDPDDDQVPPMALTVGARFDHQLRAVDPDLRNITLDVTAPRDPLGPLGVSLLVDEQHLTAATNPELAAVSPGDFALVQLSTPVPSLPAASTIAGDDAYLDLLHQYDGATLTESIAAGAKRSGVAQQDDPPSASSDDDPNDTTDACATAPHCDVSTDPDVDTSTDASANVIQHVPILEGTWSAPARVTPDHDASFHYTINSTGSVAAHPTLSARLNEAETPIDGLPASLDPDQTTAAATTVHIPTDAGDPLTSYGAITWQGSTGDTYGPVSPSATSVVGPEITYEELPQTGSIRYWLATNSETGQSRTVPRFYKNVVQKLGADPTDPANHVSSSTSILDPLSPDYDKPVAQEMRRELPGVQRAQIGRGDEPASGEPAADLVQDLRQLDDFRSDNIENLFAGQARTAISTVLGVSLPEALQAVDLTEDSFGEPWGIGDPGHEQVFWLRGPVPTPDTDSSTDLPPDRGIEEHLDEDLPTGGRWRAIANDASLLENVDGEGSMYWNGWNYHEHICDPADEPVSQPQADPQQCPHYFGRPAGSGWLIGWWKPWWDDATDRLSFGTFEPGIHDGVMSYDPRTDPDFHELTDHLESPWEGWERSHCRWVRPDHRPDHLFPDTIAVTGDDGRGVRGVAMGCQMTAYYLPPTAIAATGFRPYDPDNDPEIPSDHWVSPGWNDPTDDDIVAALRDQLSDPNNAGYRSYLDAQVSPDTPDPTSVSIAEVAALYASGEEMCQALLFIPAPRIWTSTSTPENACMAGLLSGMDKAAALRRLVELGGVAILGYLLHHELYGDGIPASEATDPVEHPLAPPAVSISADDLADRLLEKNPDITRTVAERVAQFCLARQIKSTIVNSDDCESLPIFVTGRDVPSATNHDLKAVIAHPNWLKLNYQPTSGKPGEGWQRNVAPCNSRPYDGNVENCHEFPYFATEQGGPGRSPQPMVDLISAFDNKSQGSRYGKFRRNCGIQPAQPFLIVPIPPGLAITTQTRICNGHGA